MSNFKSNHLVQVQVQVIPKKISKNACMDPLGVYQVWSLLVGICKCPISSQTIKYRYKFKSNQTIFLVKNACMDSLKVCTKFQVSRTRSQLKKFNKAEEEEQD